MAEAGQYSMIQGIGGEWKPIATNANTQLPDTLSKEWVAIESISEIVDILADGALECGLPVLGRNHDLTKWFRQMPMAEDERWKYVVHANGGFRGDRCMQMSRASSAHSGQRTSLLITFLLQDTAVKEKWGIEDLVGGKEFLTLKRHVACTPGW